jgi:hypothetical protein
MNADRLGRGGEYRERQEQRMVAQLWNKQQAAKIKGLNAAFELF